jgi:hypothetical protein
MKYKLGTLQEYLIENPVPLDELGTPQKRKWINPKKDECLWVKSARNYNRKRKIQYSFSMAELNVWSHEYKILH